MPGLVFVEINRSRQPCSVQAVLEIQALELIGPDGVVGGPHGKRRRVNAADVDSMGGDLLCEAEAGGSCSDDDHIKVQRRVIDIMILI